MAMGPGEGRTIFLPNKLFKAGQVIFREGEVADGLYYLCSGKVEITRAIRGKSELLGVLEENNVFGEMALIDKRPRIATVTAVEDSWVHHVSAKSFEHKMAELDPMMQGVVRILVDIIRKYADQHAAATGSVTG